MFMDVVPPGMPLKKLHPGLGFNLAVLLVSILNCPIGPLAPWRAYFQSHVMIGPGPVEPLPSKVQSSELPPFWSLQVSLPDRPETTKLATRGTGVTVRLAICRVPPLYDPLMMTGVDAPTFIVDTVNGA